MESDVRGLGQEVNAVWLSGTWYGPSGAEGFAFDRLSPRKPRWSFVDEDGKQLVTIGTVIGGRPSGRATVNQDVKQVPQLQFLPLPRLCVPVLDSAGEESAIRTCIQLVDGCG